MPARKLTILQCFVRNRLVRGLRRAE